MLLIVLPYLVIMGGIFYLYFAPGVIPVYKTLKWEDIETRVPDGFKLKIYRDRSWEVYSLYKQSVLIKIALGTGCDVSKLHQHTSGLIFQTSTGPGENYYISNPRKTHEIVFAKNMEDGVTLWLSVASPSVFSGRYVMEKIAGSCFYKGRSVGFSTVILPLRSYLVDFIFLGGMGVPLVVIILVFYLSGKKPSSKYFLGDPIRCEEAYVFFGSVRRFRRKNSFGYLVLTTGRLMVFHFKKPVLEIGVREENTDITIDRNKIIVQLEKEKFVLRSSKIDEWKKALGEFMR